MGRIDVVSVLISDGAYYGYDQVQYLLGAPVMAYIIWQLLLVHFVFFRSLLQQFASCFFAHYILRTCDYAYIVHREAMRRILHFNCPIGISCDEGLP